MNTKFEQIFNKNKVGLLDNELSISEIQNLAGQEKIKTKGNNVHLIIDPQLSFMEGGSLGVAGSLKDTERTAEFICNNIDQLSDIYVSLDVHSIHQIFFPIWWVNQEGEHPAPFTVITKEDVKNKTWIPCFLEDETIQYIEHTDVTIWPYHCIEGTTGQTIEPQLQNMLMFFSFLHSKNIHIISKGQDPSSDMLGIIAPNYCLEEKKHLINSSLVTELFKYDKIIISGQAKSHCVLQSVIQLIEYCENKEDLKKIYVLMDTMSSISGFEETTELKYQELKDKYGIHLVTSNQNFL